MSYVLLTRFKDDIGLIHLGALYSGFETIREARQFSLNETKTHRYNSVYAEVD